MSKFFPYRSTFPIAVYDLRVPDDVDLPDLLTAIVKEGRVEVETVTGSLFPWEDLRPMPRRPTEEFTRSSASSADGWAWVRHYDADEFRHVDDALVHMGDFAMFARRRWRRTVPASLVAAHLEIELEEEGGVLDKEWVKERKEELRAELIRSAPASISESRVLVDLEAKRVYLFDASSRVVDNVRAHMVSDALAVRDSLLTLEPFDLSAFFVRSRPKHDLPAELGSRFLEWLRDLALRGVWTTLYDGRHMRFGNPEKMRGAFGDAWASRVNVTGEDLVLALKNEMDGQIRMSSLRVSLTVTYDEFDAEYDVQLDDRGRIVSVDICTGWPVGAGKRDTDFPADFMVRAASVRAVVDAVRHVYELFDRDLLTELLKSRAQQGLFPIEVREKPEWFTDRPGGERAPKPVPSDPRQGTLTVITTKAGTMSTVDHSTGAVRIETSDGSVKETTVQKLEAEALKAQKRKKGRKEDDA